MAKTYDCDKKDCLRAAHFVLKLEVPFAGHSLSCEHDVLEMWTTIYACGEHALELGVDDVVNQETINGLTLVSRQLHAPPPDIQRATLIPVALASQAFQRYMVLMGEKPEAGPTSLVVN